MNFLKKRWAFLLWTALLVVAIILKVPFGYILLGTLGYIILMMLIRLPRTAMLLGYILEGYRKKPDKAFPMYEFGYEHGGRVAGPMIAYGMQLLRRSEYEKGLTVLQDVLMIENLNPTMLKIVRQDLAIAYWKNGDLETAISTLELMLKDYDYFNDDFYGTLGYFYIEAGQYDKATELSNKALTVNEGNGPVYDNLGLIAYAQGDLEEAKELFLKALDMRDTMSATKYYLGLIAEQEGDKEMARTYFAAAYNSKVTGINTVSREQVEAKYHQYMG